MKIIDLFAGIGGFSLAAHWMGWETIAFVEKAEYPQKVLKKNFPGVPIYDDIRDYKPEKNAADIICGGFPCQPFSTAGKRKGTEDDRFLWPEMLRIIREGRPRWVVGENVAGIISMDSGSVFDQICADLEDEGYEVWPIVLPAISIGAPHRRDRVWFIAHSVSEPRRAQDKPRDTQVDGAMLEGEGNGQESAKRSETHHRESSSSTNARHSESQKRDQSASNNKGRNGTRQQKRNQPAPHDRGGFAHTSSLRLQGTDEKSKNRQKHDDQFTNGRNSAWDQHWLEVATELCRVDDGLPGGVDRHRNKTNRLKVLGNSIVPQLAYEIFRTIEQTDLTDT